ncbi:hypothetical protein NIES2111_68320 (plasmid) [Nostoc sp. NIES-2111]|nr:hypothetical protein NIES2111_68320 [Nostoc sp. NIES-2111]
MDPASTIVLALVTGATFVAQAIGEKEVQEAYQSLKTFIAQKSKGNVNVERLEKKPNSEAQQNALKEEIIDAKVDSDMDVINGAKAVLEEANKLPKENIPPAIGVNLKEIEAAFMYLKDITATGTGVNLEKGKFQGGITITEVKAGYSEKLDQKK